MTKSSKKPPFLTPFVTRIPGYDVLFSGVPCICTDLARTENDPQKRAFGGSEMGQKRVFLSFYMRILEGFWLEMPEIDDF